MAPTMTVTPVASLGWNVVSLTGITGSVTVWRRAGGTGPFVYVRGATAVTPGATLTVYDADVPLDESNDYLCQDTSGAGNTVTGVTLSSTGMPNQAWLTHPQVWAPLNVDLISHKPIYRNNAQVHSILDREDQVITAGSGDIWPTDGSSEWVFPEGLDGVDETATFVDYFTSEGWPILLRTGTPSLFRDVWLFLKDVELSHLGKQGAFRARARWSAVDRPEPDQVTP